MRDRISKSRIGWPLAVAMVVMVAGLAAAASIAEAKGENVTFINKSRQAQELLVAFGGDGSCSDMPTQDNVRIEPREQAVVESGGSKVCWCAGSGKVPVSSCQDWKTAKAGSKVRITF